MNVSAFTWENFRQKDGTLNLWAALIERAPKHHVSANVRRALEFLDECEENCPLRKAEAAEIALKRALQIVNGE